MGYLNCNCSLCTHFGNGEVGLDPTELDTEDEEDKSNFKSFGVDSLLEDRVDHAKPLSSDLLEDGLALASSKSIMSVEVGDS